MTAGGLDPNAPIAGDVFHTVNGGMAGGRNNANNIFHSNEDSLDTKLKVIKHSVTSMDKRQLLEAEATLLDLDERIQEQHALHVELSAAVNKRKEELNPPRRPNAWTNPSGKK